MPDQPAQPQMLHKGTAKYPLEEYHLSLAGRDWTFLHTGLLLTAADESDFFDRLLRLLPYGVALWPSSIALALEMASRGETLAGKTVLELGAGTGLPGIVAASFGARVTQTDQQEMAMSLCELNAQQNGVEGITHRLVDWTAWEDAAKYDYIIGSDILYGDALHPPLRHIFDGNLAPDGRVILSDPLRKPSMLMFDSLEELGWDIDVTKWELGEGDSQRTIALFEMAGPP
jgi:predicted nicotinamide N-methyase